MDTNPAKFGKGRKKLKNIGSGDFERQIGGLYRSVKSYNSVGIFSLCAQKALKFSPCELLVIIIPLYMGYWVSSPTFPKLEPKM